MISKNTVVSLSGIVLALLLGWSVADEPERRLQGIAVSGRLMCGQKAMNATKIKIVDLDKRRRRAFNSQQSTLFSLCPHLGPDRDDLLAETVTDEKGYFRLAGATQEVEDIEVIMKLYHDCLDEQKVGTVAYYSLLTTISDVSALPAQSHVEGAEKLPQQWDCATCWLRGVVRRG